jgi:hypothetical protein
MEISRGFGCNLPGNRKKLDDGGEFQVKIVQRMEMENCSVQVGNQSEGKFAIPHAEIRD